MGQDALQCSTESTPSDDIFNRQLKIYKWRADPKCNSYIARTSFKNAQILKQQQRFNEFIQGQQNNQYLQIHKFKQKQGYWQTVEEQEVVYFEKYRCNLIEIPTPLTLEETIYTLYSLLVGFEEIRRAIGKIVVVADCCFVTMEGQIRAWINPNSKINQLYLSYSRQNLPESRPIPIIKRIIDICQKLSQKSQKLIHFFQFLKRTLTNLNQKNNHFAQIRKVINEYCFNSNVRPATNICQVFIPSSRPASLKQIKNSWIRQQRKTEPCNQTQDTNIYRSIIESQPKLLYNQRHPLNKSALNSEIYKKEQGPSQQSLMIETQNQRHRFDLPSTVLPFASQIITRRQRPSQPTHAHINWKKDNSRNNIFQATSNSNINQTMFSQSNSRPANQNIPIFAMPEKIPLANRESAKSEYSNKQSKDLSSQKSMIDISLQSGKLSSKKMGRHPSKQQKQNERKPIMANVTPCQSRPSIQLVSKSDVHHTTAPSKDPIKSNNGSHFRSWITYRTITNLIMENADEEQYVHSIADSSDCYNDSVYSGALQQMGRDLSPHEYSHPKTTDICKQTHQK